MTSGQQPPAESPSNAVSDATDLSQKQIQASLDRYWKANVWIMRVLLLIWAAVGLGAGILFADKLNAYSFAGFPLGFWFAQQGSIFIFVVLILVYCIMMNKLDTKHHDEIQNIKNNDH
jgi:putative solute:sodium symporter small subunit